jgi:hypothetical protein
LNPDNNDKKKGGRPKKGSVSRKSKTIGVCFSEPELYTLRHRAKQANLPLSVYCHDAILNGEIQRTAQERRTGNASRPLQYGKQPESISENRQVFKPEPARKSGSIRIGKYPKYHKQAIG